MDKENILKQLEQEYLELQPAILNILKRGMIEGEKRSEDGPGIDKIQLDSAKVASQITQYYSEQLIGKPLNRSEIYGKDGAPLSVNLNYVVSDKTNEESVPIEDTEEVESNSEQYNDSE